MNVYLDIPSPARRRRAENASVYGLQNHGLTNLHRVYWNLTHRGALRRGRLPRRRHASAHLGPFVVNTGKHTARAAADKFIVREQTTEDKIWWGQYNRPFTPEKFSSAADASAGLPAGPRRIRAGPATPAPTPRLPAARSASSPRRPGTACSRAPCSPSRAQPRTLQRHVPEFTVICAPGFHGSPIIDGTRSETFIIVNFAERIAIIGGSAYGGEIKKTIFTVLNFLLPLEGVLPMHCSANVGDGGDVAIFFGLSGTGKTTLSADPSRHLIGDDEHGWSENGVFNFEDGCYAKVIRLSPKR